jgi:hypothetical protein
VIFFDNSFKQQSSSVFKMLELFLFLDVTVGSGLRQQGAAGRGVVPSWWYGDAHTNPKRQRRILPFTLLTLIEVARFASGKAAIREQGNLS